MNFEDWLVVALLVGGVVGFVLVLSGIAYWWEDDE